MSDGIRNVDGAEARLLLAQFLGQVVTPEVRTLRSHTVSNSKNLQGTILDPEAVVRAIPLQPAPPPPVIPGTAIPIDAIPGLQHSDSAPASPPQPVLPSPSLMVVNSPPANPPKPSVSNDQLNFDFSYDAAKDLISKVEQTNLKIDKLITYVKQLQASVDQLESVVHKKKRGI